MAERRKDVREAIIYLTPGFHSDVVWLEDQRDYAVVLMGDMSQNLQICRVDPYYGVYLHELTYMKPYLDTELEDRDYLRELVREGRVGTGGSHSQPTEAVIGPEGLVRNILYGRLFHEGIAKDKPEVYMCWDVFGHCAQLAQILSKARFRACIWSKDIRGTNPIFFHQALDGTKLLFRRESYGLHAWNQEEFLPEMEERYEEMKSLGLSVDIRLDCVDFKPPTAWMAGESKRLREGTPSIVVSGTAHRKFFRAVEEEIKEKDLKLPVTARDYEWHHQGTGLSRIGLKISNIRGENILLSAEKFSTIANFLGAKYPDKALDKAWRHLLFNQHHDAITGPSCDRSYLDLMLGYREALELGGEVLDNALGYLGKAIDTEDKTPSDKAIPISVYNPLNWERKDVVKVEVEFEEGIDNFKVIDEEGKEIEYQVECVEEDEKGKIKKAGFLMIAEGVPSLGYKVYYVIPAEGKIEEAKRRKGVKIENEYYTIEVDEKAGGGIVRLYDRKNRKELIDKDNGYGNELVALTEDPARHEPAWEVFTTGGKVFGREYEAEAEIEKGKIATKLLIRGKMKDCGKYQEIILYKGIKRIDFATRLENYEGEHDLFVVTFPSTLQGLNPVYEERFGVTTKRKGKSALDYRTHQWSNYSDCGARRAYQWVDLNYNALIRCEGRKEVSLAMGSLGLVTSHCQEVLDTAYLLQSALIKKGIPSTPFFDDLDRERRKNLTLEDSTMPKENLNEDLPWGTAMRISLDVAQDNSYSKKMIDTLTEEQKKAYQREIDEKGYAYLLLLDSDLPEGWQPIPVLLISAKDTCYLKSAVATLIKGLEETGDIELPASANPTGIDTQTDDYGLALINRGNVLNSVEFNNTLVLFLMHTAAWGGTPWGKDRLPFFFVPEWKTHQFLYSLYPHQSSWREAKTYQVGFEVNNPLISKQLSLHKGILPTSLSFLKVGADNLIVTALKPKGNPTASFSSKCVHSSEGMIIRLYEAKGEKTSSSIQFFTPLAQAHTTNLLEERDGYLAVDRDTINITATPFSIETYELDPHILAEKLPSATLGREEEISQPVYFKHWRHNLGAGPIGYSPVAISLKGELATDVHIRQGGVTVNTIKVGVANNYTDRRIVGEVEIITPEDWKAVPSKVEYVLEPYESITKDILIAFTTRVSGWMPEKKERKGLIKARIKHEGQIYEDVIEVGRKSELEWEVRNEGEKIIVEVSNPNEDEITGEVFLATPHEMWSKKEIGEYSLGEIGPRGYAMKLSSGEKKEYIFERKGAGDISNKSFWAVAKVVYNGYAEYKAVPDLTIPPEE